ncbi:uncharacterized protein FSUBG_6138 [Fusarium subglutinans]|uniref:Tautomerase cis-CaaD-like domain-containing protein n=1 Tax=Gibberella subglutinans TaxID=42677 RepID=A0A8H5V2F1_GIBSU|nr:uncharacterized protein FSUBG_6138 [Fusarium subglutinans]KAF5606305.1 hypothetical protein FSUBG_6138 [Fusarium subglutinans]
MPLWLIYHTPDIFRDNESRQALAKDITSVYTNVGLPAFYAIVNFVPMTTGTLWKGGEVPDKPFVRISIDHIAVRLDATAEAYHRCTESIEKALKPHLADKGYDYEYHVDETERKLWRVNGFIPPPFKSSAEKQWASINRPVSYEDDE